jgi:hypothetical protein
LEASLGYNGKSMTGAGGRKNAKKNKRKKMTSSGF